MLKKAISLHNKGYLQQAESLYQQMLQADPNDSEALHLLGVIKLQQGNLLQAEKLVTQAIQINPEIATYYDNLAIIFEQYGNFEQALIAVQKSIALEPNGSKETFHNMGNFYTKLQKFDLALTAYHQAAAINPQAIDTQLSIGSVLYQQGAIKASLRHFTNINREHPQCIEAIRALAQIYQQRQELAKAEQYLQELIKLNPNFIDAHIDLGNIYLDKNQFDYALECYKSALIKNPNYARIYYHLGFAKITLNHIESGCKNLALHTKLSLQNRRYHVASDGFPLFYLQHEIQQIEHLLNNNLLDAEYKQYLEELQKLFNTHLDNASKNTDLTTIAIFNRNSLNLLKKSINNIIYSHSVPIFTGNIINTNLKFPELEAKYLQSSPQLVMVDNFLTSDALAALKDYLLNSTIWKDIDMQQIALKATASTGLINPLLCQITTELTEKFAKIFTNSRLTQITALKYQQQQKDLNFQSDPGDINCQLWVIDPESSEMKICNRAVSSTIITSKVNRMVIFDAKLGYQNNPYSFNNGYEHNPIILSCSFKRVLRNF